jgi:glycosyltransferase involved in cell wall biosynthesis
VKLLHIIETLEPGGAQRRLINDLKKIDKVNFKHSVCYLFGSGQLKREIEDLDISVFSLNLKGPKDFFGAFWQLFDLVKQRCPDVIHTQLFWADFYGRLVGRFCGVKFLVSTVQSAVYEPDNFYLYSFKRKIIDRTLDRYFTTRFVAVSEFAKKSMVKRLGIKQEKITVIPNSIDVCNFVPCENGEREKIKKELDLLGKDIVLLTVGRLNPAKGHHFLIEAIWKLKQSFPDLILLVAGDGPIKEDLILLKNNLGLNEHIRFLGERQDIRKLLIASDIFVLPTLSEGLPVSLLEAMAMQKICLASRIEAVEEIIDEEINGFLFEPGNSNDLAKVLFHLLSLGNKISHIAKRARENVLQRYESLKVAQKLENLYKEIIS